MWKQQHHSWRFKTMAICIYYEQWTKNSTQMEITKHTHSLTPSNVHECLKWNNSMWYAITAPKTTTADTTFEPNLGSHVISYLLSSLFPILFTVFSFFFIFAYDYAKYEHTHKRRVQSTHSQVHKVKRNARISYVLLKMRKIQPKWNETNTISWVIQLTWNTLVSLLS